MSSNPLAALVMMLLFLTQTPADALPYDPYPCCVAWRDEAPVLSARYGLGFDTSALKHKIFTTSAGPSLVYKFFHSQPSPISIADLARRASQFRRQPDAAHVSIPVNDFGRDLNFCHRFGSANLAVSKSPRLNFYDELMHNYPTGAIHFGLPH